MTRAYSTAYREARLLLHRIRGLATWLVEIFYSHDEIAYPGGHPRRHPSGKKKRS